MIGERVKVGSLGILSAVEGEVAEGAVVSNDDEDVGFLISAQSRREAEEK